VENAPTSPIGVAAGRQAVRSLRSANEKPPWKRLPTQEGSVEVEFVRPVHSGASVLPFRTTEPMLGIIPWDGSRLLEGGDTRLDLYPGLAEWWRKAEQLWDANRGSTRLSLRERIDYRRGLTLQFPAAPNRVVYTSGGQYLAAAHVDDQRAVIGSDLYWAATATPDEARYLTAILNSPAITRLVAPMQSRGEHNPRHFHKYVWRLPIPIFDGENPLHQRLVTAAALAEEVAAAADISGIRTFQAQRRLIRQELEAEGLAQQMDEAVLAIIDRERAPAL
jgi:hypothetical protein